MGPMKKVINTIYNVTPNHTKYIYIYFCIFHHDNYMKSISYDILYE